MQMCSRAVGKGLRVSAVLKPCIFLPSTLSPAPSQARRTLALFHSPCDLATSSGLFGSNKNRTVSSLGKLGTFSSAKCL